MIDHFRAMAAVVVISAVLAYITAGVAMVFGKAVKPDLRALGICPHAICVDQ